MNSLKLKLFDMFEKKSCKIDLENKIVVKVSLSELKESMKWVVLESLFDEVYNVINSHHVVLPFVFNIDSIVLDKNCRDYMKNISYTAYFEIITIVLNQYFIENEMNLNISLKSGYMLEIRQTSSPKSFIPNLLPMKSESALDA
jgi:hypothetical protein